MELPQGTYCASKYQFHSMDYETVWASVARAWYDGGCSKRQTEVRDNYCDAEDDEERVHDCYV